MLNFLSSFSPERNDGNSSNVVESDQQINVYVSIDPSTTEKTELECEPITPENSPTCLAWTNLVVSTKNSKSKAQKQLLNELNGKITGGLWAIMGASGSGKTTFLNALSLRIDTFRMNVSGDIQLNGMSYTKHNLKSMSGYVMQDDLTHAHFTVEETLFYTAELRMHLGSTAAERKERVDYVIQLMGIDHCRNTIVGDTRRKGISGGERKRMCVAMELLMKPTLLFLDEPTSGLDSSTALSLMSTLKGMTTRGECTVVCTIHQPQSKIFKLCDNLILMKQGEIAYQGNTLKSLDYFAQLGYPVPELTNPAEHLIDILTGSIDNAPSDKAVDLPKFKALVDPNFGNTYSSLTMKAAHPWLRQFAVLLRRDFLGHFRRWDIVAVNIFVTLLIATFTCMSTWKDLGTHKASASKRYPALFFCVIHQGIVASLQGTHSFPLERAIMLRERAGGAYYVSAYFLARTISDMCVQLMSPVIFTCVVYPIIGFRPGARHFFIFLGFMVLDSAAATSLANMISCVCVSIELSTVVMAAAYEIVRLYGGWFISPAQMSLFPRWKFADALSYIKYAFVGVALNEETYTLTCLPSERSPPYAPGPQTAANCKISPLTVMPYTGQAFNKYYGYSRYNIDQCVGYLILYIAVCRLIAYLGLRFIKV